MAAHEAAMSSDTRPGSAVPGKSVLTQVAFRGRLLEELARLSRSGGFVSVGVIEDRAPDAATEAGRARLRAVAESLMARVRAQDHVCWPGTMVRLLLPDTDGAQAVAAANRLLGLLAGQAASLAIGVASAYGAIEGGADALTLAAEDAARAARPGGVRASDSASGRPQLLIVDDDESFGEALAETVLELGWDGHPCAQAADALERAADRSYQGLFVDLVLLGTTGIDVLRRFLAQAPRRPAVLMSGQEVRPQDMLDALALGPVTFVGKPMSREDVAAALQMFRALLPGVVRR
jgi:CheY-like chemotaxis protein